MGLIRFIIKLIVSAFLAAILGSVLISGIIDYKDSALTPYELNENIQEETQPLDVQP